MRILFIVPYVPNLIRVRPYNLIRYLAQRGNAITLLTLYSTPEELESLALLRDTCEQVHALPLARWRSLWNVLLAAPTSAPLQSGYCWQPALSRLAWELVDGKGAFDVVHVEHLRGARYGLDLLSRFERNLANAAKRKNPAVVWDSVDCISLLFEQAAGRSARWINRMMTQFELRRTRRYEGTLTQRFKRVLVTSRDDRQGLIDLLPTGTRADHIRVVPNGVDLQYYAPGNGRVVKDPATLVISGKMSYHANVTMSMNFVEHILPRIWAKRPDVKLMLVGKDPTPELRALANNPLIQVTGTVDDIRPYLHRATLAVTPILYGAGIQNKVLEAMACELPVVSTSKAVSALAVQHGSDLFVADQPEDIANAVLHLLDEPELRGQVGRAGRLYVERHHQWPYIVSGLEEIYHEAI